MQITICASVDFSPKIIEVMKKLQARGCTVNIPYFTQMMLDGTLTYEQYMAEKQSENGDVLLRRAQDVDFFKRYWDYIIASDAILVLNMTKKNIEGYIGGNTLMEMGFAYGQKKDIFLYNPLPKRSEQMHYLDELVSLKPVILNGDLDIIFNR